MISFISTIHGSFHNKKYKMSSNLINKLNGMDISDMKLKEMIQNIKQKDMQCSGF